MTRWWVVVNPAAGRERDLPARVEGVLRRRHVEHEIRVSPAPDAIRDLIAEGRHAGYTAFAAVGGDGTAHLVLNALQDDPRGGPPTLAILPAGSGSDYVRSFGIPEQLDAAADRLLDDRTVPVDIARIEGTFGTRFFLNAANTGIASRTVIEAAKVPPPLGSRRYILGFWKALAGMKAGAVTVESPRERMSGLAMNVVVATGQFFGGGMNVAPEALLDDGLFDVQLIAGPRRNAPVVIRKIIHGTHLGHRSVHRMTTGSVSVATPDDWIVEADGEILGTGSFTAETLQGLLRFKV